MLALALFLLAVAAVLLVVAEARVERKVARRAFVYEERKAQDWSWPAKRKASVSFPNRRVGPPRGRR